MSVILPEDVYSFFPTKFIPEMVRKELKLTEELVDMKNNKIKKEIIGKISGVNTGISKLHTMHENKILMTAKNFEGFYSFFKQNKSVIKKIADKSFGKIPYSCDVTVYSHKLYRIYKLKIICSDFTFILTFIEICDDIYQVGNISFEYQTPGKCFQMEFTSNVIHDIMGNPMSFNIVKNNVQITGNSECLEILKMFFDFIRKIVDHHLSLNKCISASADKMDESFDKERQRVVFSFLKNDPLLEKMFSINPDKCNEDYSINNTFGQAMPEPGKIKGTRVEYVKDCPFFLDKDCVSFFKMFNKSLANHTITSPKEFNEKLRPDENGDGKNKDK